MTTLVEQGMISMGELNDNYRNARRMVFEALMELIVEDYSEANLQVTLGEGSAKRIVTLNTVDEQGMPQNMVGEAPIRVGLSDAASSPAARAQQQTQISEIIKSLGNMPQAVAVLVPPFIKASGMDSETRRQVVEDFRKAMGMPAGGDRAARADDGPVPTGNFPSRVEPADRGVSPSTSPPGVPVVPGGA
jgi:hypothetical protein